MKIHENKWKKVKNVYFSLKLERKMHFPHWACTSEMWPEKATVKQGCNSTQNRKTPLSNRTISHFHSACFVCAPERVSLPWRSCFLFRAFRAAFNSNFSSFSSFYLLSSVCYCCWFFLNWLLLLLFFSLQFSLPSQLLQMDRDNNPNLQINTAGAAPGSNLLLQYKLLTIKYQRKNQKNEELKSTLKKELIPVSNSCLGLVDYCQNTSDYMISSWGSLPEEKNPFLQGYNKMKNGSGNSNDVCCTIMWSLLKT